ncbi:ABC transporter ATP-binding protein [Paracoccus denitrificans]|jgi:branched-chain amino acid transport system ATP-binding protein|uniref:Amino acid/amide ABC transporter ATP-binding protein 2, HAAT family n=1 Tax=Paracoccus denitrificans (strain Pd 1222) TaxID=318586 RepID=A1B9Y8_PARDP|nr:ABC transporter ATP-binding protein [Paracoccus denitrificans]ABL72332.1 amino acid/amide ABC transporter ATP-binding protein 2, HAAT family [Paracoccus denitrificans PD1222]MBB4629216.1 branched-chain amino acid transport system ATP-binding protein [Paracoccus denitrificans]MCU7430236.1 ABC transporter ATP-binding protein [Paracoccus denitrificans]QAR28896.1 ABC transporter ATP-binding protein [Paracoccus denitrificans]UPV97049.1 ABC transporter ATP-binding protein [Paracoccus denitrifican
MTPALRLTDLHSYYGKSHILQGVTLEVGQGEIVTLLGRNGAGKSTTLKTAVGLITPRQGRVELAGRDMTGQPAHRIAAAGLSLVPEDRGIFQLLTVEENLRIAEKRGSPWSLGDIYRIFPRLEERRKNGGGQLSGGEQQMLSIARALLNGPKVLMLDEPVEGLAPIIVEEIVAQIRLIREAGVPILLVEQNLAVCSQLADRHYILELGRIMHCASADEFRSDPDTIDRYLGVKA